MLLDALYSELHRVAKRELRRAQWRGGGFELTSVEAVKDEGAVDVGELQDVSEALNELGKMDPALAEVVDLNFFCGFSFAEIAEIRGQSERTVQQHWEKARICLYSSMRGELPE